jgi:hypothetical protein
MTNWWLGAFNRVTCLGPTIHKYAKMIGQFLKEAIGEKGVFTRGGASIINFLQSIIEGCKRIIIDISSGRRRIIDPEEIEYICRGVMEKVKIIEEDEEDEGDMKKEEVKDDNDTDIMSEISNYSDNTTGTKVLPAMVCFDRNRVGGGISVGGGCFITEKKAQPNEIKKIDNELKQNKLLFKNLKKLENELEENQDGQILMAELGMSTSNLLGDTVLSSKKQISINNSENIVLSSASNLHQEHETTADETIVDETKEEDQPTESFIADVDDNELYTCHDLLSLKPLTTDTVINTKIHKLLLSLNTPPDSTNLLTLQENLSQEAEEAKSSKAEEAKSSEQIKTFKRIVKMVIIALRLKKNQKKSGGKKRTRKVFKRFRKSRKSRKYQRSRKSQFF